MAHPIYLRIRYEFLSHDRTVCVNLFFSFIAVEYQPCSNTRYKKEKGFFLTTSSHSLHPTTKS